MVTTRRQQKEDQKQEPQQQKRTKDETDDAPSRAASSKKPRVEEKARCEANQPLVDVLHRLSGAMFRAQIADTKNRYKGLAISRAAHAVAQLDFEVRSGQELAQKGDHKVAGIGKGTANYIDEFLESGELFEIDEYERMAHEAHDLEEEDEDSKNPAKASKNSNEKSAPSTAPSDHVVINRAPVLTLWVTVVAQRQGFSRLEALTYGKFVSAIFAHSKGKALGMFKEKESTKEEREERKQKEKDAGVHHVQGFGRMKIPTLTQNDGNRLAVIQGETQDPTYVEDYLQRSFGGKLEATQDAMKELAGSIPLDQLESQAYKLYEQFRPAWKGWGKKSVLDLALVREMAKEK